MLIIIDICVLFAVVISSKELCLPGNVHNNNLKLTGDSGTLKSPLKHYPPGLSCSWLITVPKGKIVKLTFSRFKLDPGWGCGDYIEVLDGQYALSKRQGKYCGYDPSPGVIHSSGRYMRVEFRTNSLQSTKHEGFEATFKAVDESGKCSLMFNTFTVLHFLTVKLWS